MNLFYKIFLLLFLLALSIKIGAQTNNIKFSKIRTEDGISQGYVTCAFQDSRGFMWFGTQDGLNRYDGYNFKIFRHSQDIPNTLSENWIWNIYEDSKGYIWCGTFGGGVCRFDRNKEEFQTFRNIESDSTSLSHNTVWSFYESADKRFWIGTNNGLNLFHPESQTFTNYSSPQKDLLVFRILPMSENRLLITSIKEVYTFNLATGEFFLLEEFPKNMNNTRTVRTNIFLDNEGIYWMGSDEDGIFRYDLLNDMTTNYKQDPNHVHESLANNMVLDVIRDSQGSVWAATSNGLSIMKFEGDKLTDTKNYFNDPANPFSISGNYLSNIYESRGGEIWISARNALNRFDQYNKNFLHFSSSSNESKSLSHNGVLPIVASKRNPGIIWIGTRDGLNKFNEKTGEFTHYKHSNSNPSNSLSGNYILSICEDSKGNLWVGTRGEGVSRVYFDREGSPLFYHFKNNPIDETTIAANNVHFIYEDSESTIWIGTGGGGLNRYNPGNNSFTRYNRETTNDEFVDDWVYTIHEDQLGNFWLGTAAGGLSLFDRDKNLFTHFRNDPLKPACISNNRVLSLLETRSGDLWIGTALGLNKLIRPENNSDDYTFRKFYQSTGLPNDVIYGMLEDDSGNLWVSTNNGLCKISFEDGNFVVKKFDITDGLQNNEFDQNSFCKGPEGKMYFGGINGFNVFHPDSIKDNLYIPPVVITDFKILNESVPISNGINRELRKSTYRGSVFLDKSISETDTIYLSYTDDVLSIEFAALNYTVPEKNQYSYKMEGFDKDWIYAGTRRFVTYTNLDAGEYVFRVRACNNDGIWNNEGVSLTMFVAPPPWATWWAYGFYLLVIILLTILLVRKREKELKKDLELKIKINRAKAEERELVRKKTSQDFHDEAGNKITKITLFTELVKRELKENKKAADILANIEGNVKELSAGMRDFLWILDAEKDTLADTIKRIEEFGNSLFEYTETSFTASGNLILIKHVFLPMEVRRSLILIFKEAMNNCIKYAEANNVVFGFTLKDDGLTISLKDDGRGFTINDNPDSYGLKNMRSRAEKISGSIAIESEPGKGTSIIFKCNITHMGN